MTPNWRKLVKRIPSKVQIARKLFYDVVWVSEFRDNNGVINESYVGLCDKNKRIIYILNTLSNKEKVLTYLHELIHAFSDENDIGITERQVGLIEKKCLTFVIKSGNIFT